MTAADTKAPARTRRERHHPEPTRPAPQSPASRIWGHIPRVRREGMMPMVRQDWAALGDAFTLRLGPRPTLVVAHPDAFERVLAGHKRKYVKGRAYDAPRQFLGNSLVTLEGDAWRQRRRLAQPYFHRAGLATLFTTMVGVVERFLDDLRRRYPQGGEIDMHREMVDLTLDVVCTALFGPGVGQTGELSHETLAATVEVMESRLGYPIPLWVPTRTNRRFSRVKAETDAVIYQMIARARATQGTQGEPGQRSTLLGMLLDTVDDAGHPLRDEDVRNEVLTLYVAGHETTALTMTWMFVLLEGAGGILDRLAQESDAVLGGRSPDFADLPRLVYTRQVIDETLRMRSPTPMLARIAVEDDNLCGHPVEAGQMVLLFFWGLHHHPQVWERPEVFDPARFEPDRVAARDSWAYLPFSGGPRTCIGNNFALYEAQLITSMMMQRAHWEVAAGQRVEPTAVGTLRPSTGVRVRVRWR